MKPGWWKAWALWACLSFMGGCAFAVQMIARNEIVLDQRGVFALASAIIAFTVIGGTLVTLTFELIVLVHRLWERQKSN
jgi:hypothetical protein